MGSFDFIIVTFSFGYPLGNFLCLTYNLEGPHLHKFSICKLPFDPITFIVKRFLQLIRDTTKVELNFVDTPEIMDSVLMLIPDENSISFTDNIPSVAPIQGYISQRMENKFSITNNRHGGIDIVAKQGTPIKASASGLVIFSGWTYEMGNLIIIHHGDGYFTHYGHNQQNLRFQLDMIKKGEVIGLVGDTGISSGPHLHFEIWKDNKSINPLIYFPEYNETDLTSNNNG